MRAGGHSSDLRRLALGVALVSVSSAGCALPWVDGDPGAADAGSGDYGLAIQAEIADDSSKHSEPSADGSAPTGDVSQDRDGSKAAVPPAATGSSTAPGPGSTFPGPGDPQPDDATAGSDPDTAAGARLARVGDLGGDVDRDVPAWADVLFVELADDGTGHLVIHVDVAGTIPPQLADGEVAGVGVDLYTSGDTESDHQIFLDGSVDGWFAYLHTGGELVAFPGTFALDGTRFSSTVPWTAIGNARRGDVAAFADWSTRQVAGLLATSSHDRVPDDGRVSYG